MAKMRDVPLKESPPGPSAPTEHREIVSGLEVVAPRRDLCNLPQEHRAEWSSSVMSLVEKGVAHPRTRQDAQESCCGDHLSQVPIDSALCSHNLAPLSLIRNAIMTPVHGLQSPAQPQPEELQ